MLTPTALFNVNQHYFLPHHAVIKADGVTTKLRVVFDATCQITSNISLNDVLLKGSVIQEELFTLLVRFRTHKYVLTADVKQMYHQVQIEEKHRDCQLILWRSDSNKRVQIYRLITVTYGSTVPISFLATAYLHKLAEQENPNYPFEAEVIKNDFYMDDVLTGSNTISEAMRLRNNVITNLRKGGFDLQKWVANDPVLLEGISESDENDKNTILEFDNGPIKILGLIWDPKSDVTQYKVTPFEDGVVVTKRKMLSDIASIYVPLGLIDPIITQAKLFLQKLFCEKLDWDESLPKN